MANPQLEDGHLDLANEIVEALAKIRISGTEWQLLWVILRKTYGWHKKRDTISLAQFHAMTGLPKPHVVRYLKKLLHKKIIVVTQKGKGVPIYGFNKDFEEWEPLPKKITLPKKVPSNKNKETSSKETRKDIYGLHVELTGEEYEKLVQKFAAETVADVIEFFNLKIESKGVRQWRKDHKSDYATILYWERNGWIRLGSAGSNPALSTSSRGIMGWAQRERERLRRAKEK